LKKLFSKKKNSFVLTYQRMTLNYETEGASTPPPYQEEEGINVTRSYEITREKSNFDNARLVLLPKGHKDAIVFDVLKSNQVVVPLTLKSHEGYGLELMYPNERDYKGYKYIEITMGHAESAVKAWYDGTFVTLAGSTMVLDITFWKYEEGNTVNFVKPPGSEDPRNRGGGRSFRLESDGTMSSIKAPQFVLGLKEITKRLKLVEKGSKNVMILDNFLYNKGDTPLTLKSHPGKALTLGKFGNYMGYLYYEIHLGEAGNAARASYDGEFVTLADDNKVFDVAFWDYRVGNEVNFVSAPMRCCCIDRTRQRNGGRSFLHNTDGTLSLMLRPDLVLGVE